LAPRPGYLFSSKKEWAAIGTAPGGAAATRSQSAREVDHVVPGPVALGAALDAVHGAVLSADPVGAGKAEDPIGPGPTIQLVCAGAALEQVLAPTTEQAVAGRGLGHVDAGFPEWWRRYVSRYQRISLTASDEHIRPTPANQLVAGAVAR